MTLNWPEVWGLRPEATVWGLSAAAHLVSGQLSDLDDLHSELDEQSLQDQALLPPVLLAQSLVPLAGHTALQITHTHRRHTWARAKEGVCVCVCSNTERLLFLWENIDFTPPPPLARGELMLLSQCVGKCTNPNLQLGKLRLNKQYDRNATTCN